MLSYNTSYHSTIATLPIELLFGTKPRLPSFPNPDIQRVHYGESTSAEHYQLLQKIRFIAKNIAKANQDNSKSNFDKNALPHSFNIDDLVWYKDFSPLGKNPKLKPKWSGPAKITEVNDTNARILLPNGKSKVLNVMHLKKFFSVLSDTKSDNETIPDNLDFNAEPKISGPVTRAMKKLMDHKNAVQLAINVLCDLSKNHCAMCEWEQECSDNPLLLDPNFVCQYIKEPQAWLINKQSMRAKCKLQLGQHITDIKRKMMRQHPSAFISSATILIKWTIQAKQMLSIFKN
jgi:hypothetical protein